MVKLDFLRLLQLLKVPHVLLPFNTSLLQILFLSLNTFSLLWGHPTLSDCLSDHSICLFNFLIINLCYFLIRTEESFHSTLFNSHLLHGAFNLCRILRRPKVDHRLSFWDWWLKRGSFRRSIGRGWELSSLIWLEVLAWRGRKHGRGHKAEWFFMLGFRWVS